MFRAAFVSRYFGNSLYFGNNAAAARSNRLHHRVRLCTGRQGNSSYWSTFFTGTAMLEGLPEKTCYSPVTTGSPE